MNTLVFSRVAQGVLGLGFSLLLSSCFETKEDFTINPDGSGKVRHECSFQETNFITVNHNVPTPEEALQAAAGRVIHDSKGVEVWRDVSFKKLSDGRIWFQGTAYFKNLEELEITNQSIFSFTWNNQGGGKAEMELQFKKSHTTTPVAKPKDLTSEERAEKLKTAREKYKQTKPMFSAILGGLQQSVTFQLPGKITSNRNFTKRSPNTVGLVFEGSKLLDALDKLSNDDAWLIKNGFDEQQSPELDNEMCGLLFGEKTPVRVIVSDNSTPLFDYAAEVAAAKKELPKLEKQLGGMDVAARQKAVN